jgi:hypothetical protein
MADVYNYDQKFKEGVTNARALEGLTKYTPTISAEKVTDKSDPVSRGILNMQTQGRNMEGLFGNQVNAFGQKVDPAAQRAYREMTGRNPLYKFSVDKGTQNEVNIYENIQEPDVATAIAKGIPTDFATSVDKLVRGVSGDRVDTSSLFTLGGRLANAGEFAYESRKGDRAGVVDDIQNAGNILGYLVGGGGTTLRGAALLAKLGKGYDAAATLSKASKMGRVTNPIDIGVPVAGQNASSIIENPRAAAVAGGTGGAILTGLLTKGKGGRVAVPAAAIGGAALASSAVPERADAIKIRDMTKLLTDGAEAMADRVGRNLATQVADRMFGTMRNRGGGKGRIPAADMKVRPNKEYVMQMVEENRDWFTKNKDALDIYPSGKQEGHAVSASHPPGMDPSLASSIIPDHFTGGKLNEIEKIINAERRQLGLPAFTNYKNIIEAAINKANNAGFGSNTYAATLRGKSLDEAKVMLGAVDVKYYE